MRKTRKPSIEDKFTIITVQQMVFLFDNNEKFINVWHKDNLSRTKPGELDIFEGVSKR